MGGCHGVEGSFLPTKLSLFVRRVALGAEIWLCCSFGHRRFGGGVRPVPSILDESTVCIE